MSFDGSLQHKCTIQTREPCQKLTISAIGGAATVGQTVTGSTSLSTGVITRVFATYLVVKDVVGAFIANEPLTIGITFSATFGVQSDYENENGEPEYYWQNAKTNVPCLFWNDRKNYSMTAAGTIASRPLQAMLPCNIGTTQTDMYRLVTTDAEFTGTYDAVILPKGRPGTVHHYEAVLTKVQA